MNKEITTKVNEAIKKCSSASFGLIDEKGYPSVSTVSLIRPETISEIYFSSGLDGNKAKRLQKNSKASICCCIGNSSNITLVGDAEIFTDQETKSKYWLDWFKNVYEGGETDPNYCVIKFTTKRVSLWIGEDGAEFEIER
ncbi:MAG: pyridoxamine 5'-phosphate oxidase family protein [Defluviitaleaceae bacterium]|nr:pyridoxamine 5'-phosphate oxidase family protein [Defluviitaleaceae bacterium]